MPLICPNRLTIIRNSKMTAPIRITFTIAIRFRSGCRTTLVIFFRMFPVLVAASLTFPGTLPVKSSVETRNEDRHCSVLRRVAPPIFTTDFPPCRRSTCPPAFNASLASIVSSFRSFRILPACLSITKALSAAAAMILPSTTVCATAMCSPAF